MKTRRVIPDFGVAAAVALTLVLGFILPAQSQTNLPPPLSPPGYTLLIAFGNNQSYRGTNVPSPDIQGHYWNSVGSMALNSPLTNAAGGVTTMALAFEAQNGNDFYNGPAGTNQNPADCVIDTNALGYLGIDAGVFHYYVSSEFEITNLNPARTYSLSFFGSHAFSTDAATVYSLYTDASYSTVVTSVVLNVMDPLNASAHNSNTVATISGVFPQPNGVFYIGFLGANGHAGYLNCMQVDQAAPTNAGNITGMTLSSDPTNGSTIATFSLDGGNANGYTNSAVAVTAYAPDVVRVQYSYNGLYPKTEMFIANPLGTWPAMTNAPVDQGTNYLLQTGLLNVIIYKSPFHIDFVDALGGYSLLRDDPVTGYQYDPGYFQASDTNWAINTPFSLPSGISRLKCTKIMPASQGYFGLGEYPGPGNRRGANLMCWNHPSYQWAEGAPYQNPLYINIPFFYGLQPGSGSIPAFAYGIFFDNPCLSTFRLGTQTSTNYSFEAADGQMDYYFFSGSTNHTMKAVLTDYTQLTGMPSMLPKWGLGHQLSRACYFNQNWVEYIAQTATLSNIPLDAVYVDIDYMDQTGNNSVGDGDLEQLKMNTPEFPNPASMVASCAVYNVKVIPIIEPWLEPNDPFYAATAASNDFILVNGGGPLVGTDYVGIVSWFDYSSTAGRNRWETKETNWFSQVPFGGIWNDLNEPEDNYNGYSGVPLNATVSDDGAFGASLTDTRRQFSSERNYFSLRSSLSSYTALLDAYPNKRPFILARSGNAGSQRYAINWSGDTTADWCRLAVCIRLGANMMISGQGRFGHDLGGFDGSIDGELITRWYEAGSVMPFYREHSFNGDNIWADGNQGREPWRFNPSQNWSNVYDDAGCGVSSGSKNGADGIDYCSLMRNNIQFRYELMPYLYTLMRNATVNGIPMNTPTYFDYYTDNNTLGSGMTGSSSNEYDFLVGDFMLASPVYTAGATTRTTYLPYAPGVGWYYLPTGTRYSGFTTVTVPAPLGTLPLFVRSDAIIPEGPSMQYANQFQPGYLDINCWPETSNTFTLYEDAGDGWDFTNGAYSMTTYTSVRTSSNWNFTIAARVGSYVPYSAGARTNNIYMYNPPQGAIEDVLLNGMAITNQAVSMFNAPLPCWFMTSDGKLAIRVLETPSQQQSIHVDWAASVDPYNNVTVAGTFSNPPWNQPATNMTYLGGNIWQGTIPLNAVTNMQFKFVADNSWAPTNWGGSTTAVTIPVSSAAVLNSVTNILVSGTLNGTYQFTFDDQPPYTYSVTPILASPYIAIYIPGTYNGWSPSNNVMTLLSNDTWQATVTMASVTNLQFKFAADGNWSNNWGQAIGQQTQFTLPLSGVSSLDAHTNIFVNGVLNGNYQFTFYDLTGNFTVTLANGGDSVGDGISDAWRAEYFSNQPAGNTNGIMTNSESCASCDADGTGQDNLFKYLAGLNPTNPESIFMITSVQPSGTDNVISFTTVSNNVYLLQATSLDPANSNGWFTVTNNIPGNPNNGIAQATDPGGAAQSQRIYRAVLQQTQ